MQAVPKSSKDWLRSACIVYDHNWSADFQGKEKDKQVFFLDDTRRVATAGGAPLNGPVAKT
jgi:hypothetical protein